MKFLVEELYIMILRAKQSKKRKRNASHEVVIMEVRAKVVEERVEPTALAGSIITTLAMMPFSGVASASFDAKVMPVANLWRPAQVLT